VLRIDLLRQEVRDRQAALRPTVGATPAARRSIVRRRLGAWLVRFGRVVAGRPSPSARLA